MPRMDAKAKKETIKLESEGESISGIANKLVFNRATISKFLESSEAEELRSKVVQQISVESQFIRQQAKVIDLLTQTLEDFRRQIEWFQALIDSNRPLTMQIPMQQPHQQVQRTQTPAAPVQPPTESSHSGLDSDTEEIQNVFEKFKTEDRPSEEE